MWEAKLLVLTKGVLESQSCWRVPAGTGLSMNTSTRFVTNRLCQVLILKICAAAPVVCLLSEWGTTLFQRAGRFLRPSASCEHAQIPEPISCLVYSLVDHTSLLASNSVSEAWVWKRGGWGVGLGRIGWTVIWLFMGYFVFLSTVWFSGIL